MLTITPESANVLAYRHDARPLLKVQASPNNHKDPASRWSAYASEDGASLTYFAGKSFKSQASADKAIRKYLETRAARV